MALARRSPRVLLVLAAPAAVRGAGAGGAVPGRRLGALSDPVVRGDDGGGGAFLWALPRGARLLRVGGVRVPAGVRGVLAVHSPVGSNVERYGVLLAGPLLLCARLAAPAGRAMCRTPEPVRVIGAR